MPGGAMSEPDKRIEPTFELEPMDPAARPEAQSFGAESRHFRTETHEGEPYARLRLRLFMITSNYSLMFPSSGRILLQIYESESVGTYRGPEPLQIGSIKQET